MADEKRDNRQGKQQGGRQEPQKKPITIELISCEVKQRERKIVIVGFVSQGASGLPSTPIDLYFGPDMRPFSHSTEIDRLGDIVPGQKVYATQSDANGRFAQVLPIPEGFFGSTSIWAITQGMARPVSSNVEIAKPVPPQVALLDIEPAESSQKDDGAHTIWTVRAFDADNNSVEAYISMTAARPFKLFRKLSAHDEVVKDGAHQCFARVKIYKDTNRFELIVPTPGLLEIDVFVEGQHLKRDDLRIAGAKALRRVIPPAPAGAGILRRIFHRGYHKIR